MDLTGVLCSGINDPSLHYSKQSNNPKCPSGKKH
jgi:hypothetical protein